MSEAQEVGRGREARGPSEIPARGWRDILLRVKDEMARDNLSIIAAGVAFYGLFAIFPALAALVSIYGLLVEPQAAQQQIAQLEGILPEDARGILRDQLTQVTESAPGALGLGVLGGLLLTLWSAGRGTMALIEALNIVYDEQEKRGFIRLNAIALALTLGLILFIVVALGLVAVLPAVIGSLGLPQGAEAWARWLRWPILAGAFMLALAALYRYGPSRAEPRWRWVTWGALAATLLWIAGSLAFSWYVANFGNYNETYGSVGAVAILMMWFWLSAFIVLLGAELNAEMEHQTERDSTSGAPQPIGRRGAYVADHVGEVP